MASLTGQLVAETYKALLKTIDNDILTASEKQITDGFGGGSNVFIDSQGFLRANKYKVTNGLATQFLKADGSLDSNTYLTGITSSQIISALGYTPVTNARTLTINGTTYDLSANRSWTIAGTAAVWGNISGTLSDQTDLQNALNAKFNNPTGTISQYIRGDGSLATFPAITGFVPYTGATANVNLGEYGLNAGFVQFDTTPTGTPTGIGKMYWDAPNRTVSLLDGDGDTTLQIGQEERVLVHNNTGATLTDGNLVYVTGSTGELPSVALASASMESLSAATLGMVTESIPHGSDGFVTTSGIVHGLNTLAFNEGDQLWLSATAGQFTTTKPISPNHLVLIGYVIKKAGGNGSVFVKIQNTQELDESSDVLISTPKTDGQGLFLQTISGVQLWRNRTIDDALGYTPQRLDKMVSNLLASSTEYPNSNAVIAALALKANAENPVFTGYMTISGAEPKLYFTDTDQNPDYFIGADAGFFRIYDQTAGATRFVINSSGVTTIAGDLIVGTIAKSGGTATQFLKADGSIDSSTYVTSASLANYLLISTAASTYQRLDKMVSNLLASDTEYPNSNAVLAKLALKADAANPVFTGDMTISGISPKLYFTDTDNNPDYTLFVDSGYFYIYDQTAGATKFQITPSGNAINTGTLTSASFIKSGGTSSQYLMADGSVSTLSGLVTGSGSTNYLPKWTSASALGNSILTESANGIGIGIASANGVLQFSNATNTRKIVLYEGANNDFQFYGLGVESSTFVYSVYSPTDDHVFFAGLSGVSRRELLRIKGNGNGLISGTFNIKNSSTTASLSATVNATGEFMSTGSLAGYFWENRSGGVTANTNWYGWYTTSGAVKLWNGSSNLLSISGTSGNMSIGSDTDAGYKLDVNGTIRVQGINPSLRTDFNDNYTSLVSWKSGIRSWQLDNVDNNFWLYIAASLNTYVLKISSSTGAATFSSSIDMGLNKLFTGGGYKMHYRNSSVNITFSGTSNWQVNNDADNVALMSVLNGGNVLIGTTTDTGQKLQVYGSITSREGSTAEFRAQGGGYGSNYNTSLRSLAGAIGVLQFGNNDANYVLIGNTATGGYLSFRTNVSSESVTSGTEVLRLNSNGTSKFIGNLDIESTNSIITQRGGTGYSVFRSYGGDGTSADLVEFQIRNRVDSLNMVSIGTYSNHDLTIRTNNTQRMIVGSDGAMGFNYPLLGVRSFMFRALSGRPLAIEIAESGGVQSVYIRPNSSGRHLITSNYLSGGVYLPLALSGRENDGDLVLAPSGNIIIGTATDSGSKFRVHFDGGNGSSGLNSYNILATTPSTSATYQATIGAIHPGDGYGNLNLGGNGVFWHISKRLSTDANQLEFYYNNGSSFVSRFIFSTAGNLTATAFFESSDMRLKKLIDGSAQVAGIENLEAKLYEKEGKIEFGYFAQDAEKYMPYSVSKNTDGFLTLSYREVHTAKIARLEKRVAELEKQLNLN